MVRAKLTVMNEQGIHLGPANIIANVADKFDSQIHFQTEYMGYQRQEYHQPGERHIS